jgi:hypothetical protein
MRKPFILRVLLLWRVTPCILVEFSYVSEEHTASISGSKSKQASKLSIIAQSQTLLIVSSLSIVKSRQV